MVNVMRRIEWRLLILQSIQPTLNLFANLTIIAPPESSFFKPTVFWVLKIAAVGLFKKPKIVVLSVLHRSGTDLGLDSTEIITPKHSASSKSSGLSRVYCFHTFI